MNVSQLRPGDAFELPGVEGTWEALPETCVVRVVHREYAGGGVTAHLARVAIRRSDNVRRAIRMDRQVSAP